VDKKKRNKGAPAANLKSEAELGEYCPCRRLKGNREEKEERSSPDPKKSRPEERRAQKRGNVGYVWVGGLTDSRKEEEKFLAPPR